MTRKEGRVKPALSFVNILTVSRFQDRYHLLFKINGINNPIISKAITPESRQFVLQGLSYVRRILRDIIIDLIEDALPNRLVKLLETVKGFRIPKDPIAQGTS